MHILIVEDEALVAADVSRMLKKHRASSTATAASGAEALQQIAARLPDVVLMDIKLQGPLDGIAVTQKIQQEYDLPVIFLTAHSDQETLERIKTTRLYGYLLKPIDQLELYTTIDIAVVQHIAEKKLRQSEDRYRTLLNTTTDGFWAVNLNGEIIDVNEAYCQMTGFRRDEIIHKQISDFGLVETPAEIQEHLKRLVQRGFDRFESHHRCKNGGVIEFEISTNYVPQHQVILGFLRDITARKASERQILHLNQVLQHRADEMQSLYDAEHQQRTLAETLVQTSQVIATTLDVDLVLDRILEQIGKVVAYDVCNIMLLDGENTSVVRSHGYEAFNAEEFIETFVFPLSGLSIRRQIIQSCSPLVVADVRTDPQWALPASAAWLRSYVAAPICLKTEVIGLINVGNSKPDFYTTQHAERLFAFGHQAALAFQNARLFDETRKTAGLLQVLSRRLLEVQETERRVIARELHDEIGQALTATRITLQSLQNRVDSTAIRPQLEECASIISLALQQVRNLSLDLHPAILDDLGLLPALRWFVDREAQWGEFSAQVRAENLSQRLPTEIELVCFRVVQEALTNVARHAHAHNVTVELWQRGGDLHLVISDDGVGFDPQVALDNAMRSESLGLLSMQERISLVGGQIEINSTPGSGAEIHARIPIERKAE